MFSGGEKIAIPYLGRVDVGEPTILAPTNTRFKLKQHADLNVSKIVAADFSIFQIWDEKAAKCSFYTFWTGGVSKSLTPGFLSATFAGPWNDLLVTKPMAVNQSTGATRFTTGGCWCDDRELYQFHGFAGWHSDYAQPAATQHRVHNWHRRRDKRRRHEA
jgi:hypothetical protein